MTTGWATIIAVLARRAKPVGEVEARALFNVIGAGLTPVIQTVGAAELAKAAVEFFGATRTRHAGTLATNLHG